MSIRTIVKTMLANYAAATTGAEAVQVQAGSRPQLSPGRGVRCAIQ